MSVKVDYRPDRKKWQVTFYLDGKRKRPLFAEKPKAEDFARKIRMGLAPEDVNTITLAEASQLYYTRVSVRKNAKSRSNDKRYLNLQEHFMFAERGIERIGTVALEDMEAFRNWLEAKPVYMDEQVLMGANSINRCLRVLKHFYKKHVQWKNIGDSPCLYLDMLDVIVSERPAMSGEQYLKTLEACLPGWPKETVQFTFLTGIPPTAIERLDWTDVNLANRSYSILRKKGVKAQWRRIPMGLSEPAFAMLVDIRNRTGATEGPVFRDECGRRLLADRVSREANAAIRRAGVTGVTFYGLRHALATDSTAAGIATEVVRQIMGHQSIATTQRYANKVKLSVVTEALESVRGGKLVASGV